MTQLIEYDVKIMWRCLAICSCDEDARCLYFLSSKGSIHRLPYKGDYKKGDVYEFRERGVIEF